MMGRMTVPMRDDDYDRARPAAGELGDIYSLRAVPEALGVEDIE